MRIPPESSGFVELDEIGGEEPPAAFDRLKPEARSFGKAPDGGAGLVMRVADQISGHSPLCQPFPRSEAAVAIFGGEFVTTTD